MARPRTILALAAHLLATCGQGPAPDIHGQPSARDVAIFSPRFGDTDPVDWPPRDNPRSHPVHGIDTSVWQGDIDWPTLRLNGVNFAFLKATEGGDLVDPAFAHNWAGAAAAGVARGAYHFYYHCRPASQQARWYIAHVPRAVSALPPVLDMEWTPRSPTCRTKRPAAKIRAEARIYLDAVQDHYGQRPILYTTLDFFQENELWKLGGVDFWLRSTAVHPSDSFPAQHWTFWQYSATGTVPGIRGKVDLNAFAGTRADWTAWLAR